METLEMWREMVGEVMRDQRCPNCGSRETLSANYAIGLSMNVVGAVKKTICSDCYSICEVPTTIQLTENK
jgi:hypothetical protein